jgi:hypothetical protein
MKSIIEPRYIVGKEYRLIKRISTESIDEPDYHVLDNMKLKTIGKGFIPYLMYQENVPGILQSLDPLNENDFRPDKEQLFNVYYKLRSSNYHPIGFVDNKLYRPSNEEIKERFGKEHILTELDNFKQIPDKYKTKERTELFNDYLKWVKGEKVFIEGKKWLNRIPTKPTDPKQILDFWLRLQGQNEKGDPYWESTQEIEHFVNQNFEGFPSVNEIIEFDPNMNKSELYHITWIFFDRYGKSKTKRQYENLLIKNFTKFKDAKDVYSNIKYQSNEHLNKLFDFHVRKDEFKT